MTTKKREEKKMKINNQRIKEGEIKEGEMKAESGRCHRNLFPAEPPENKPQPLKLLTPRLTPRLTPLTAAI